MKNKRLIIVLAVVAVITVYLGWLRAAPSEPVATPENNPIVATFTSPTMEFITVSFVDNTATLTGLGYDKLVLPQVIAASGARYEDAEKKLVLWNKGDEVTVYKDDTVIFTGSTALPMPPGAGNEATSSNPNEASGAVAAQLAASTWIWDKMVIDGATVTPKEPGSFTLTFGTDGRASGTTDCNSFSGTYTAAGDSLSFGPLASTKMYCEGSQELLFTDILTRTTNTVTFSEGNLTLVLPSDAGAIYFAKKVE